MTHRRSALLNAYHPFNPFSSYLLPPKTPTLFSVFKSLFTPVRMAKFTAPETTDVGTDAEKGEHFCTIGGNANWCSQSGKQYGSSSKKLKIELPYDPAIALLGIYPQDTGVQIGRASCRERVSSPV